MTVAADPLQMFERIIGRHGRAIPHDVRAASCERIRQALAEWRARPTDIDIGFDAAFMVHSRRTAHSDAHLDDVGEQIPALAMRYGIPYAEIEPLLQALPPFRVGTIAGGLSSGKAVNVAIISTPITPQGLEDCRGPVARMGYARPRIADAVALAVKLGARTIGLGGIIASLTRHARTLEPAIPRCGSRRDTRSRRTRSASGCATPPSCAANGSARCRSRASALVDRSARRRH